MRKEKLHTEDIIRIIMRHIDKSISEDENKILQEWLNKSEENQNIFSQITSENKRNAEIIKMSSYKKEDAWKKINRKAKGKQRFNISLFVRIAASVVIILSSTFLIWKTIDFKDTKISEAKHISTGRSVARLITATGESYNLDTTKTVIIGKKDSIENDGKLISFSKSIDDRTKEEKIRYNTIEVPIGGEYNVKLSDGTIIYLNSESSLRFPNKFSGTRRDIFLKGEAYFEVKKDKKPFIVHINDTYIKVLGTSFNINAYSENNTVQTTLVSGSVAMGNTKIKKEIKIKPGYQAEYNIKTKNIESKKVNIDYYVGWKNGIFAFKEQRFEDVMKTLSRWYEFEVFYQNPEVKDIVFTGKMKRYSDIKEILRNFEMTEDLNFKVKGKIITIKKNK